MKIFEKQDDEANNFITKEKIKKLLTDSISWDRETLEKQEEFNCQEDLENKDEKVFADNFITEQKIKKLLNDEIGKGRIINTDEFYNIYKKIKKLERIK